MIATRKPPTLYVEGSDDCYALHHLLFRHDIPTVLKKNHKGPLPQGAVVIHECENDDSAIKAFKARIPPGTGQTIGIVLDADKSLRDRWRSIRDHLSEFEIPNVPGKPPVGGFTGMSVRFKTRVGVWIMPDNEQGGKLEDFLMTLIGEGDKLIAHAQAATDEAKKLEAKFTEPDVIKAVIHCWLAWQREPGRPYGVAIKSHYFQHNSQAADRFVAWFKRLYGLEG